ncbi:MAG TPA: Pr6Pr family membrane protein, partial [Amycolatopsis sp.]|uniref:Pr6Pr family membrane protein n=1 Tax=Amycolatopsis sp. TaxID=37632 RepID=UPI002F3FD6DB
MIGGKTTVGSRWWHAVIAAVVVVSLVIQLVLLFTGGADATPGRPAPRWASACGCSATSPSRVLAVNPLADGRLWRVVRLDALLGILITGLVYAIVLAPQVHLTGAARAVTIGFHYISPWATVLAWLLFGPRPRVTWGTVSAAFAWALLWLLYIFVQGAFTHWYPYPFLDAGKLGLGDAVRNALLVVVLAAAF